MYRCVLTVLPTLLFYALLLTLRLDFADVHSSCHFDVAAKKKRENQDDASSDEPCDRACSLPVAPFPPPPLPTRLLSPPASLHSNH
jgi:hypothetical protein